MSKTDVYITKIVNEDLEASLARQVEFMQIPKRVKSIGIKVNLCDYRKRETGATTDPEVLTALLKLLREQHGSAEIFLIETDATGTVTENILPYLGITHVAEQYDVQCCNLVRGEWFSKKINGCHFKEVDVSKILEDCDYLINHPKLKTHSRTKITCGLKNMYACYRTKYKVNYHKFLNDAIVDINLANKVDYTLVDANLCHEGNRGPINGVCKKVGLFIGGKDVVAVDTVCARLMKFRPYLIPHIRKAQSKGVGSMRYNLVGDVTPKEFNQYKFEYSWLRYFVMNFARKVIAS